MKEWNGPIEYHVWTSATRFKIFTDKDKALKYAVRSKAGEVERLLITTGGCIVDVEVIWRR